jgi:UDP-N-acetylmuramyl pentapeptide synthase
MGELGKDSKKMHQEIGAYARQSKHYLSSQEALLQDNLAEDRINL